MARVTLELDAKRLREADADASDVRRAVERLLPNKLYGVEDIRSLAVPGRKGTTARLSQVAKVSIVFKARSDGVAVPGEEKEERKRGGEEREEKGERKKIP
jgi:hypothetical protein